MCSDELGRSTQSAPSPQVQDSEVLEMLLYKRQGGTIEKLPMEAIPSPENPHLRILCQLPGEAEGEGDLDGAALDTREAW